MSEPTIEVRGSEVFLDGINAGVVQDVMQNYPALAEQIQAEIAAQAAVEPAE